SFPCTEVGALRGFDFESKVVLAPSHDTASAVAACSVGESGVYISSGTWSLIGTENANPVLSEKALKANFTNEGGINCRFRFLKNYMGMWLFQNIRKDLNKELSYDDMMNLAKESGEFYYINTNDEAFLAPENMIGAIKTYLKNDNLSLGAIINSVYHSLAQAYANVVSEIESVCDKEIDSVNIVGGGCKDEYLNYLTAQYTGKKVFAGPVEATATGNLISQMMFSKELESLEEARELVKKSFDVKTFEA
ncbi:MAG: rhamnulokinase, partial [Eubacterium sp.]|nr:rhamnulokinase [Eubacterium sp.]